MSPSGGLTSAEFARQMPGVFIIMSGKLHIESLLTAGGVGRATGQNENVGYIEFAG